MAKVTLDLPPDEGMALAQLCKRFTHDDAVRFAKPYIGGERDAILDGIDKLRRALAEAGFAPR